MMKTYYDDIPDYVFGKTILDIGSGDGSSQLQSIHKDKFLSADYLGLDVRAPILDKKMHIFSADIVNFEFETKRVWDTILAIAVMEHIPFSKWELLFEKLCSWVSPNGYLVVMTPSAENINNYIYSKDYLSHKNNPMYGLNSPSNCHVVFDITPKLLRFVMPKAKIKELRCSISDIPFREDGESFLWAIGRLIKRILTFHPYFYQHIRKIGRKKHLLAIWCNKEG